MLAGLAVLPGVYESLRKQAGEHRRCRAGMLGRAGLAGLLRLISPDDLGEAQAVAVVPHVVGHQVVIRAAVVPLRCDIPVPGGSITPRWQFAVPIEQRRM
jgi:hypothetical protein